MRISPAIRSLSRRRAFVGMFGLTTVVLAGRLISVPRAPTTSEAELEAYFANQTVEPYSGSPLDDRRVWAYRFTGFLPDLRINSVEGEQQYRPTDYRLTLSGLISRPMTLDVEQLRSLPADDQISDFYCVDGWAVPGLRWRGIRFRTLFEHVLPLSSATHVGLRSIGGVYTESIPLDVALRDDVMLAIDLRGEPLPSRHGAPLRLVVPPMYGYKSIKWVERIDFLPKIHLGYWERRGYHPDAWLPNR